MTGNELIEKICEFDLSCEFEISAHGILVTSPAGIEGSIENDRTWHTRQNPRRTPLKNKIFVGGSSRPAGNRISRMPQ